MRAYGDVRAVVAAVLLLAAGAWPGGLAAAGTDPAERPPIRVEPPRLPYPELRVEEGLHPPHLAPPARSWSGVRALYVEPPRLPIRTPDLDDRADPAVRRPATRPRPDPRLRAV